MNKRRHSWPVEQLAEQLRQVGVAPGDRLFVHTGLRALRLLRRDVPHLLAAYQHVLGPRGALYFPLHTYSYKGEKGHPVFDVDAPCHPLLGAWPELVRTHPGVVRSKHPTHSIGGIGYGVRAILAGHEKCEAVGLGSPLDKLKDQGGKVLLAGCGFESCTLIHLAETYAQVPYLTLPQDDIIPVAMTWRGRNAIEVPQREMPGCSDGFPKIQPRLWGLRVLREGRLGEGRALLCGMRPLLDAAIGMLRRNPRSLLCDDECPTCAAARKVIRQAQRAAAASRTPSQSRARR